jgi:hypothetical protein
MPGALEKSVRTALNAVTDERDAGAVQLAITYAQRIDAFEPMEKLGPALLQCLESLLMTPRARAAVVKGVADDAKPTSPLDELRRRREHRTAG